MSHSSPIWPAIIEFAGQPELSFVLSEHDARHQHLQALHFRPADRLIDSAGNIFRFNDHQWQVQTEPIALPDLLEIIRNHVAQQGECCVAKFSASTIAEAIRLACAMDADAA